MLYCNLIEFKFIEKICIYITRIIEYSYQKKLKNDKLELFLYKSDVFLHFGSAKGDLDEYGMQKCS